MLHHRLTEKLSVLLSFRRDFAPQRPEPPHRRDFAPEWPEPEPHRDFAPQRPEPPLTDSKEL